MPPLRSRTVTHGRNMVGARALMRAKQLGGKIKYLSKGEVDARNAGYSPYSTETWRAWEYWARRAGVGDRLGEMG